ncbi:glycosyl hydrolase family 62-domain-containing protein [Aspergillus tamarii]|uniref:Alpha-L-arabinofuranosidase n=1 Tax=Aspergillus tamarii TaxID=41984 RepID=A0A5N6UTC2_ASPTM|nr:glycosyl hydrolase family 62-domain-containing protein [Aspergillus tamarii]
MKASLPMSFELSSSGPLIGPKDDGYARAGIKEPSTINTAKESGYHLGVVYLSFPDFNEANSATFHYLDQTLIETGYRAAPEVFYFGPHKLWYLVYQNGNAAYCTNSDISNPAGWSAPKNFFSSMPNDNGHLYRSQTSLGNFPNGMENTAIALQDMNIYASFEASNVYSTGNGEYLLLIEAIGSDDASYFRSWTSASLSGAWTSLADTEVLPFVRSNNVIHGEMIRTNGVDPNATGDYTAMPWKLGILTQANCGC